MHIIDSACSDRCYSSSALGGICVGQVVKHAGGVQRGFSIIGALILTGLVDFFFFDAVLSISRSDSNPLIDADICSAMLVALPLVISATYIHIRFPYKAPAAAEKSKKTD